MTKPKAIKEEEITKEDLMGEIKIDILKNGAFSLQSINHLAEGKEPEPINDRAIEKILVDLHQQMFEARIVASALEGFRKKLMT